MSPRISDRQKEERRSKILNAAKLVFTAKGYEAATFKDILDETGMSRGWIYLYFQTKEEIFEALLDQQDMEYEEYLAELTAKQPTIWDAVIRMYADQKTDLMQMPGGSFMPAFYEYFLGGSRDERRRSLLLKRYETGLSRLEGLLRTGVERGEFSPVLPLAQVTRIAAAYQEGISTHTLAVGPELAHTELQIEALLDYLKQLLNPRSVRRLRNRRHLMSVLFRNPVFTRLFLANFASQLGTVVGNMAFAYYLVDHFSTRPALAATAELMYSLPTLAVFWLVGVIADLLDRARIAVYSDWIRAGLTLLLLVALHFGLLTLCFLLLFLRSAVAKFFGPAEMGLLQGSIGREQYVQAAGLNQMIMGLFMLFGMSLGAFAYRFLGIEGALLIDGISFLLSGLLILSCRFHEDVRMPGGRHALRISVFPG